MTSCLRRETAVYWEGGVRVGGVGRGGDPFGNMKGAVWKWKKNQRVSTLVYVINDSFVWPV